MHVLIVPMNPEYFPELVMLIAGTIAVGVALGHLFRGQLGRAFGVCVLGVALVALAFALGRYAHNHAPYQNHVAASAWHRGRY